MRQAVPGTPMTPAGEASGGAVDNAWGSTLSGAGRAVLATGARTRRQERMRASSAAEANPARESK